MSYRWADVEIPLSGILDFLVLSDWLFRYLLKSIYSASLICYRTF